jgi:hypothetical protein
MDAASWSKGSSSSSGGGGDALVMYLLQASNGMPPHQP